MKKTGVFLLLAALLMLIEIPVETQAAPTKTSIETTIFKKKRKGYKSKRGGLFNTGLFRKKSSCGCPKH